ncbi:MAG: invasin domain 3-containing protein [Pseudomonadota bacterium]|nr:invasin domain 3-containing protein [Pseudomonadota bacterium]
MLRTSRLLARLALGGLLVGSAALAPEVAWAQAAPAPGATFEGTSGLIELVTPTGLVGDGATAADLYVLALSPAGAPITGLKGKPTATAGTSTELVEVGGGLYRFLFTPAKADSVTTVTLSLKGKLASKEAYSRAWSFTVAPARSQRITVATNPPLMVLSQDVTASVAINLAGGDRQNLTGVDLAVRPSAGAVENLLSLGGGQFTALYTAPTVKYPHLALITVVDRRDPSSAYAGIAVPLVGKADYPVTVAPNSRVILKVGGRDFGPIQADAMGRASVPIIVPPGASNATRVQIAPDGKVTEDAIDLKIPEARRIALFPAAAAIPSDGRLQVPVRAMVVTADGKPDEGASVVFSTTAGIVSAAKHESGGIYVATYTPPFGNAATQATIAVNLADKPALQSDSLLVNLVPARPTSVALTTEPASLPAGAEGFKVFAKVTGPDGAGLGSRSVNFTANGARLKDSVKDLRNGDYQALFTTTGNGPVELAANVSSAKTGNPLARVLLLPARERLPGDGVSSAMVTVATVDEFGYPVPNQAVAIKLTQGDGTIPATATTNEDGIAQVFYTAGRKNGVVSLTATVGDLAAATTLVQAPVTLVLPDLPVSASKQVAALAGEWQSSLASVRLEREGMPGTVLAPTGVIAASTPGGAPSKMALLSDPATVTAGGTVVLKVSVLDANGRGVGGQQLDFLTSTGTVGAVADLGGGAYQATLNVPAGTTGEVKISAATRDGSTSTFMRVPVGGADAAWGANPFATTAVDPYATTQPVAATPPTTTQPTSTAPMLTQPATTTTTTGASTSSTTITRAPTPDGDRPWLRIRGGYSYTSYTYEQLLLTQSTVLFPAPIGLENAGAQGFQVAGRVWVPGLPYLGANVEVRAGRYTLDPAPLCAKLERPCADAEPVGDWLVDAKILAAGRYPFEVGASQFWVGAQAGWSQSDVQAYKVVDNSIELDQLSISSLAIGPEVGVEVGKNVFFHTYFLEHLAGFTTPYNTQFGVDGGYAFGDGSGFAPYVSAAYDFSARKVTVRNAAGDPVGEVSDGQHAITLSLGVQL